MKAVRRGGLLFVVLIIGIFLGTLGLRSALLIVSPLFIIWFMLWDEKRYSHTRKKNEHQHYIYRKYP
ncbi:hypothetical protein ATZ33_04620 [Enterococcus silesiacus]|uniref:Uncharacterized protein n=1 Tax=Enterococcus silesiacus TaxID=332949 RepID=A0A0S3K8X4_9ENTE|nr:MULTISPECIES: hypothetical protein [Enterococcus]ALS00679.1 hypothetical protein ATZ33_04620 [Enterococcus silesiacus]OJG86061.1 hypothetical protein RV15_GL002465 [Enterococcus silesiacus]OTP53390.1 hypothetical protein A5881_000287 [Enterococcus termitis]